MAKHSPPPPPVLPGHRQKAKPNLKRILGATLTGCAVVALPFLTADDEINWAVYEMMGSTTFRAPMPKPMWGGFYSKQVQIDVEQGNLPIRVEEVSVESNMLFSLARMYTFRRYNPSLNQATVVFDRIDNPSGFPFGVGDIPIGGISMSPAEALGCGELRRFGETEIREMGLSPVPTRISERISVDNNRVTVTMRYDSPGLGSAEVTRIGVGERVAKDLMDDFGLPPQIVWKQQQWNFEDKGFIKARNSYCASKLGVSEEQFLGHHLAAVERELLAEGLSVSAEIRNLYIDYAANGGVLNVDGQYGNELTEENFHDIEWKDQLSTFVGEIKRDRAKAVFSLTQSTPIPFADSDAGKSTYSILQREGSAPAPIRAGQTQAEIVAAAQTTGNLETVVVSAAVDPDMTSRVVLVPLEENETLTRFSQLGGYVGRKVRIERSSREPVIGKVLGMGEKGVRLRIAKPGGYIELDLPAADFRRAQVFPTRS